MSRRANAKQYAFVSGTVGQTHKEAAPLSQFEALAQGIPVEQYLNTPKLVDFVRSNFETLYTPPFMIASLGLRFSDTELNDSPYTLQDGIVIPEQHATPEELPTEI
jgi:hypothetical protein